MMPPDDDELEAVAEQLHGGRTPGAQASRRNTLPTPATRSQPAMAPAPSAPPSARISQPALTPPPGGPSQPRFTTPTPTEIPEDDDPALSKTESLGLQGNMELVAAMNAPKPAVVTRAAGTSGTSGAPPVAAISMDSIPLAHEPVMVSSPVAPAEGADATDSCSRCGTRVYQSMIRCPNCMNPLPVGQKRSAPRVSTARRRGRSVVKLVAGLVLVAGLLGGGIFAYLHFFGPRDDGAPTPEEAVTGMFHAVFDQNFRQSLKFVHPSLQGAATSSLADHERRGLQGERIVAIVARTSGVGRIGMRVEKIVTTGEDQGKVELLLERDGLPMRRAFMPIRRDNGRWYVEVNPFGGIP